jgi:hypothetical protein
VKYNTDGKSTVSNGEVRESSENLNTYLRTKIKLNIITTINKGYKNYQKPLVDKGK